ncbi:MAG: hypothetical protein IJI57_04840 [Flexilinea sp.]|nr:hypothetical protein [Flexilinea sp.]
MSKDKDTTQELIEKAYGMLDKSGLHYSLVIELPNKGGYSFSGRNTFLTYLSSVAVIADHYLNDAVPQHGQAAIATLKNVVQNSIDRNKAVPKDKMERARMKLDKYADDEKGNE